MIRRPPRSTRTDTLFPYTTLFRSRETDGTFKILDIVAEGVSMAITLRSEYGAVLKNNGGQLPPLTEALREKVARGAFAPRSEERRVGKEWVSTCRSRWSPYH